MDAPLAAHRPRVLLIGTRSTPDSMEWHVEEALRRIGCAVERFATEPSIPGRAAAAWHKLGHAVLREPERLIESRLMRRAREFAPSLVLVIQGSQISPKSIAALRRHVSAPVVCWCQDQMTAIGRQYILGAEYDAVFLKDRYMLELFSSMIRSTRFHYLAEACNPRVHRTVELSDADRAEYGCELVVFGTLYYYRQELLRELKEFDLRLWGAVPDWMINRLADRHGGRSVMLDDKVRAVRAARIALNPLHYAEVDALNCRAFELAGCGAFQLITARPVLREHFEPGVEVETFASIEELVEKSRHYLAHPEQADAIAQRGQRRAHAEHTYEARLRAIFGTVLGPAVTAR